MPARSVALAVTIAILLLAPSSASAISHGAALGALPLAQDAADEYWDGRAPDVCGDRARIRMLTGDALWAIRSAEAAAYGVSPTAGVADAEPESCTIRIAWDGMSRTELCVTLIHEEGHLRRVRFANPADPAHSPDYGHMMHAQGIQKPPDVCLRRFVPWRVKRSRRQGFVCGAAADVWAWTCTKGKRERTIDVI